VLTLAIGFPKYDAGKGQSVSGDIKFGYNLDRSEFSIDSTVNFGIRYERRVFGAFVASLELSTPISAGSGGMSLLSSVTLSLGLSSSLSSRDIVGASLEFTAKEGQFVVTPSLSIGPVIIT